MAVGYSRATDEQWCNTETTRMPRKNIKELKAVPKGTSPRALCSSSAMLQGAREQHGGKQMDRQTERGEGQKEAMLET